MWRSHMPITMADDRRVLQVALRCCSRPPDVARMAFIRDTLSLDRIWVSPSLRQEVEQHMRLSIVDETPLQFDARGTMISPWELEPGPAL